jgi:hypothetical protein
VLVCALSTFGQSIRGELRLEVADPSGRGLESRVELTSEANDYRKTFATDERLHRRHSCGVRKKNRRHCRTQYCARYAHRPARQVDFSRRQLRHRWCFRTSAIWLGQEQRGRERRWRAHRSLPETIRPCKTSPTPSPPETSPPATSATGLSVSVRHELSRFLVPNEQLQQAAGQRQDRDNFETMGMVSCQRSFLRMR